MLQGGGDPVCLARPKRVKDESTYMYAGLFDDLKVQMSFTPFESQILRAMNVALRNFTLTARASFEVLRYCVKL